MKTTIKRLTEEEPKEAIASLKEICRDIGCSGLSPSLCDDKPHQCSIIRRLIMGEENLSGSAWSRTSNSK